MHSSGFGGVATLRSGMLEQMLCANCGGARYASADNPANIDDHCVCADGPCVRAGIVTRRQIELGQAIALAVKHSIPPRKNKDCIKGLEEGMEAVVVITSDGYVSRGFYYLALAAWWNGGGRLLLPKHNRIVKEIRITLVEEAGKPAVNE